PELAQPLPKCAEQGRPIGRGRQTKKTYPRHLSRLLRVGGERRDEETHGEDSAESDTPDQHAAIAVCWFNVTASLCSHRHAGRPPNHSAGILEPHDDAIVRWVEWYGCAFSLDEHGKRRSLPRIDLSGDAGARSSA